jgi:hypothetical protein
MPLTPTLSTVASATLLFPFRIADGVTTSGAFASCLPLWWWSLARSVARRHPPNFSPSRCEQVLLLYPSTFKMPGVRDIR